MVNFSSLNPYESLVSVVGDSPESLVMELKKIHTPIKIIAIVPYGTKQVAYILGDHRISEPIKKTIKKGI